MASGLHLPDLSIRAFRGIDNLQIPRLGRVTLVVGENGVGKTTLIEAVRIYASRGSEHTLAAVLAEREELYRVRIGLDSTAINWSPLFFGRDPEEIGELSIGPIAVDRRLQIEADTLWLGDACGRDGGNLGRLSSGPATTALRIAFRQEYLTLGNSPALDSALVRKLPSKSSQALPNRTSSVEGLTAVGCLNLGPSAVNSGVIESLWPSVVLTDFEDRILEALRIVYGSKIERIAVITLNDAEDHRARTQVVVKIDGIASPVPIQSLGDGAIRIFGVALCLAASRNGFLMIEEAGNGIHHTLQNPFWRMVVQDAERHNVQVIATTHAWDSVCGFAESIANSSDGQGVLLRLERHHGSLRAVEYSTEAVTVAAREGIEVR